LTGWPVSCSANRFNSFFCAALSDADCGNAEEPADGFFDVVAADDCALTGDDVPFDDGAPGRTAAGGHQTKYCQR